MYLMKMLLNIDKQNHLYYWCYRLTLALFCVLPFPLISVGQSWEGRTSDVSKWTEYGVGRDPGSDSFPKHERCQAISVSLCSNMPYNQTIMPNILGQQSQEEAGMELHQFFPLVKINCSEDLHFFLCSVYIPVCTILDVPIPPCRPMCVSVKNGCEKLMNRFGFQWPKSLDCKRFPVSPHDGLCVEENTASESSGKALTSRDVSAASSKNFNNWNSRLNIPAADDPRWLEEAQRNRNSDFFSIEKLGMSFRCPLHFTVPEKKKYAITIGGKRVDNCGAPCHGMFFDSEELRLSKIWVGGWAFICLFSSTFTVISFLINVRRFRYPERPIIFISMCYWFIALTYVVALTRGDKIACDEPLDPPNYMTGQEMVSTISQGVSKEVCTIVFMTLYFFTMAASIWWVVLTITWFLAAGLKWSHEALEKNSAWFHVAAWAVPAVKTTIILAMEKVEGDVLTGVCFVGLWNVNALRGFVLAPLFLHLVVGTCFLVVGFISMFRIRTIMKHDGTRTDKLERFMVRIGVFSFLYTVPAWVLVACLFYEQYFHDTWTLAWQWQKCHIQDQPWVTYDINCPPGIDPTNPPTTPPLLFFLIKYLSTLVVGVTSGFWVCTGKTVSEWKSCLYRCVRINQESQPEDGTCMQNKY